MQSIVAQIEQVKQGDEQALAAIIAKQMPMIRALAARAVCPGLDFDDAVQEGIIALFSAIESFDDTKGASFQTYANVCVQNAVNSAAKAVGRNKHAPLNTFVPLDETEAVQGPEELLLQSERYQLTVQNITQRLSELERQVLRLFLENQSYAAIAKRLSITEKAVGNALQRVRAKLK